MTTHRARILAIDDNPANLLTLGAALENEYELQIATSGPAGLALAQHNPPDLILLDIMMPDVDGFETFRRLASDPALKDIPVIFVTAMDDLESEVAGLQLGAADYVTKPIRIPIARQRIRNLLEREQLRKEVQLQRDQLRKLAVAVEQSPTSVEITNLDACLEYVNQRFTEVTGYSAAEVIGKNPRILKSGLTSEATYRNMWETLTRGQVWKGELVNQRKNGATYWEEAQIAPVRDANGVVSHYVAVKTDISERKALEERAHKLAFYDSLTDLPNRRLLDDRLAQAIAASKRSGCYCALMFLDLDNFKQLNDLHGHASGDLLLVEVAKRLTNCVREVDTVVRFGGDEFVVLLSQLDIDGGVSTEQARAVAEKIRVSLAADYTLTVAQLGQKAFTLEHRCSASIGVVVFTSQNAVQADILKWADAAMYRAKEAGRNAIKFYGD